MEVVAPAALAFAATNVDDVLVLAVLFARRDERFGAAQIVTGQFLGFAVLVVASVGAAAGLLQLPDAAVALLGVVPLALGIHGLLRARSDEPELPGWRLGTAAVAGITIANGADNVAVYAPLFAALGWSAMAVTVTVFFALLAVLCVAAAFVGSRPAVVRAVDWAGDYAVPVVFIVLGLAIIATAF